jgi:hypothetical protein
VHPWDSRTRFAKLTLFQQTPCSPHPDVEIFPAFNYAQDPHTTTLLQDTKAPGSTSKTATFHSATTRLQLDVTVDRSDEDHAAPDICFRKEAREGMLGEGIVARLKIHEGQAVSFILRNDVDKHVTENITTEIVDLQQHDTQSFWYHWISKSKYQGRWREVVQRSLMLLKMMTYEPTGAIIAAPTFSVPEDIGGVRCVGSAAMLMLEAVF